MPFLLQLPQLDFWDVLHESPDVQDMGHQEKQGTQFKNIDILDHEAQVPAETGHQAIVKQSLLSSPFLGQKDQNHNGEWFQKNEMASADQVTCDLQEGEQRNQVETPVPLEQVFPLPALA